MRELSRIIVGAQGYSVEMDRDPFDLDRFVIAQEPVWDDVRAELQAGHKQSHWMWFIFPQLAGLGRSAMARHYGVSGLEEATAYLAHPVLGERLRTACRALLQHPGREAAEIMGPVDAMKLRSCLSLFLEASAGEHVFRQCLEQFFGGAADPQTMRMLA